MKRLGLALFCGLVFAPLACGNDDDPAPSDDSNSMGGDGGDGDASACLFDCEQEPAQGDGDGDNAMPVDQEFINKGSIDYCTFDGEESKGDAAKALLLTDFESGENEYKNGNGIWGTFWASTDGTGTTNLSDSTTDWLMGSPGRDGSKYAMHMMGEGFKTWGGGVNTSLVFDQDNRANCLYDASAFSGVTFWARGEVDSATSEMTFYAQIPPVVPLTSGGSCEAGCWDSHRAYVEVTECWQQYVIPFDDLKQAGWGAAAEFTPEYLRSLEWTFPQGVDFDVYIDDVAFFTGEPPTPGAEDCSDVGAGGAGGGTGGN